MIDDVEISTEVIQRVFFEKVHLQHFGSARAISGASLADLEAVGGVSRTLAQKIYDFFHPTG